jgi:23S rRNA (cytidine1920-2'-O)/16S rRNA (cytidine1409-2'-O)-methyltransferase
MRRGKLDAALVARGLAETVDEARQLIVLDRVLVNGAVADNANRLIADADQLLIVEPSRFVSRGGEKLEHALATWSTDVTDLVAVDLGSSTGGFTDCLLQRGCRQVIAVDVGENLLHERLAGDARVTVMSGVNVKDVERLPESVADIVVVDLSFISATSAIPAITRVMRESADVVVLVKPQFEATKAEADRSGGVISDASVQERVVAEVVSAFEAGGFGVSGILESPIRGGKGNLEFLARFRRFSDN